MCIGTFVVFAVHASDVTYLFCTHLWAFPELQDVIEGGRGGREGGRGVLPTRC
jgi:hypothetical protein